MPGERFYEEADNPLLFWLFGSMIVIGFIGIFLWVAKNTNQTGLVSLIQHG
jgi:uncharacterized membrane-anchored protein